jgi:flavin-dependent dehydrogenase
MVEAFEDGWWYTAGLPDGRGFIGCMTDADLARTMRLHDAKEWLRKLDAMPHVGAMARHGNLCSSIVIRSASSRRLEPAAGDHWLAVGDSASRFDPLSSQGIAKALRSAIFASYAIGDLLTRDDESGIDRYRRYVLEEFGSYAEVRAKYYREEQRWPESEFWRRRHAAIDASFAQTDSKAWAIPPSAEAYPDA